MDVNAPLFPESIAEGEIAQWYKQAGEWVERDDLLVDIETEKTTMEVPAPIAGILSEVLKAEGDLVLSEELLAVIDESAEQPEASSTPAIQAEERDSESGLAVAPSARKLAQEHNIALVELKGTGRSGLITKQDVQMAIDAHEGTGERAIVAESSSQGGVTRATGGEGSSANSAAADVGLDSVSGRIERRVPMTRLRATIARRLVEVQQTSAMLTTFNEANMEPIMRMRRQYQSEFTDRHHGTRLGYMSFFVRASVEALKRFPAVNASIDGDDIVYHGFYDIGVAVSTQRGLVVPIVRDADALGMAQIENQIVEFSEKARDNKLAIEDMQGGTFTISNGGIFGSLLSTPILNPPQTAILGMHKIQDRAIVEDGDIVARPMMYLALSYDHRLIDGQEAVRFLATIKGMLEDPARILLEL